MNENTTRAAMLYFLFFETLNSQKIVKLLCGN